MNIEFGVFDHMDRGGLPIRDVYANRLRLVEAYDEAGFYAYHLAEHHATSLGMAPAPGVFLAAVAQRTRRLRFGPMVYVLPLHEPLRLIEEICILDNLSGGRLELGVGRGFSPFELAYFGVGLLESRGIYEEALEVILKGLQEETLTHRGEHFRYDGVPMALQPVQRPHPPLWHGLTRADGAPEAARRGVNVMMNGPAVQARPKTERYLTVWRSLHGESVASPKLGLARHIHVADSDEEALATARQGYEVWYRSNAELWRRFQSESTIFPRTVDDGLRSGAVIVGKPDTVRRRIEEDLAASGCNYLVARLAFGDIAMPRLLRCVELFATEIIPYFRGASTRTAAAPT